MRQISGPPTIFMTSNVVTNLFHKNLVPHRGSANWPKMDKFENLSIIYCSKSKLKGGQFILKMPTFVFWAPYLEICQSAHNHTKSELKGGSF